MSASRCVPGVFKAKGILAHTLGSPLSSLGSQGAVLGLAEVCPDAQNRHKCAKYPPTEHLESGGKKQREKRWWILFPSLTRPEKLKIKANTEKKPQINRGSDSPNPKYCEYSLGICCNFVIPATGATKNKEFSLCPQAGVLE